VTKNTIGVDEEGATEGSKRSVGGIQWWLPMGGQYETRAASFPI